MPADAAPSSRSALPAEISHEELLRRLGDPSLRIVNVLPRPDFERARIPGSFSLPVAEIPFRAAEVLPGKDQEVAVYCASPT